MGTFNSSKATFQRLDNHSHWAAKGLPDDPGLRQIAHYFDLEAYQNAKRAAKAMKEANPKKKVKWYRKKKREKKVFAWQTD